MELIASQTCNNVTEIYAQMKALIEGGWDVSGTSDNYADYASDQSPHNASTYYNSYGRPPFSSYISKPLLVHAVSCEVRVRAATSSQHLVINSNMDPPTVSSITKLLLDNGCVLDSQTPEGTTALMAAVIRRDLPLVKLLCAEGADKNVQNRQGLTAIDLARKIGYGTIYYFLL